MQALWIEARKYPLFSMLNSNADYVFVCINEMAVKVCDQSLNFSFNFKLFYFADALTVSPLYKCNHEFCFRIQFILDYQQQGCFPDDKSNNNNKMTTTQQSYIKASWGF